MFITVFLLIGCALVAIASVPLVLRLVPPNPIYGFRTERALDDSAYVRDTPFLARRCSSRGHGGVALIAWSGTCSSPHGPDHGLLLLIAIAVGATFAYDRRTAKR